MRNTKCAALIFRVVVNDGPKFDNPDANSSLSSFLPSSPFIIIICNPLGCQLAGRGQLAPQWVQMGPFPSALWTIF